MRFAFALLSLHLGVLTAAAQDVPVIDVTVVPADQIRPAGVALSITRSIEGRDAETTSAAIAPVAARALDRCARDAEEARPLDAQLFVLHIDARGRVARVQRPPIPTREPFSRASTHTIPIRRTMRARVARWIGCAARALRGLRFEPGPAGAIEVRLEWREGTPGVLGILAPR